MSVGYPQTSKKALSDKTISGWVGSLITDAGTALSELPRWERGFHIFWLLGPFILLIERSPADVWLTVLSISFVIRSIIKKDGGWLKLFWVKAAFLFWAVTLVTSLFSTLPLTAFSEALVWFRFPLFAMATLWWLASDSRLLKAMYLATGLGLLMMCGILSAELIIEGQKTGRLMWPYGDLVPGNYVTKVGLPTFAILAALAFSVRGPIAYLSSLAGLFVLAISIFTGERINFLILACGGMLAGMMWKPVWTRVISTALLCLCGGAVLFYAVPELGTRYISHFISQLPTGDHSTYFRTMMPGIMAFMNEPLLGVGTGNMRHLCTVITEGAAHLECHPHPHHFYIQMAAENGIFGLITGTLFLWSIIWTCFKSGRKNKQNILAATAWVIPFGLFWPIASFADFFGQWNNIFMWSALALALAASANAIDQN